jgi:hypothetical protein
MTGPLPALIHPACGFALVSTPQAGPVSPRSVPEVRTDEHV